MSVGRALLEEVLAAIEGDEALRQRVRAVLAAERHPDDMLSLDQCEESVRTLRRAIRSGALPAIRSGRSYLVRRADLVAWRAARRVQKSPPAERAGDELDALLRTGALRAIRGGKR